MKRPARIAIAIMGGLALLVLLAGITVFFVARSGWLREKLRTVIVERAEIATGGRVEIGKFSLDWTTLTADVDGFVIHGTEASGQAPLLAVDRVTIGFRIISIFTRDIRLDRIDVIRPKAHIIVDAQGGTNMPRPKVPGHKRTADAILDVKIARFAVHNGEVLAESAGAPPRIMPWMGNGRNLEAKATYDPARDRYSGDISLAPLHLTLEGYGPLDVNIQAAAAMERNRIVVSRASVKTTASEINLTDLTVGSFAAPAVQANYVARVSAAEAIRALHGKIPVVGEINVAGKARYVSSRDFDITGDYRGANLTYDRIRNIRLTGSVAGTQDAMAFTAVRVNLLGGEAAGRVDLTGYELYKVHGDVKGLGVKNLAALGTTRTVPYDGLVSGTLDASGRIRDLSRQGVLDATAKLTVSPAAGAPPIHGEISAHYTGSVAKLEMGHSWVQLPSTRVDVTGTLGASLDVKLETTDLNDLIPVLNGRAPPFSLQNGSASFSGTVNGALDSPRLAGRVAVTKAVYQGRLIDSAAADVTASMSQASATNAVIIGSGITASGNGSIALVDGTATDASAIGGNVAVTNVDLTHALDLAGQKNVPVTGILSATAHVSGTLGQPLGNADVTLSKGLIYGQPYDSVTGSVKYTDADSQSVSGVFASGPKRVNFDVAYERGGQTFPAGTLQITVGTNSMPLNQIALVRQRQPDIEGAAEFKGTAAVRIGRDAKNQLSLKLMNLNGDGSATGIALGGRDLGDSHFTARTQGSIVTASFDSNAANAAIKGEAKIELTGDDRTTGSLTFSNAGLNALAALAVTEADAKRLTFDGTAAGQVDFSGPLFAPGQMSVTATVRQFEVHPLPNTPLATTIPGFSLRSSGPVKVSIENSVVRVESARFLAPETDMTFSGTAELASSSPLNLHMQGEINLAMLRNFVPDLASSGILAINGTVRGNWSAPDLSGSARIRSGEFHYSDFTNGLTNAAGEIVFTGSRAIVQSFTADSGGGKFTASGFATVSPAGSVAFQITAKTRDVRVRYPRGVSSISDSDIQLVRTPQRSSISGTVTLRRLVINPQQDASAMLADMSQTVRTPATGDTVFANMNLDVQIRTAPDVVLQSKVAESIQAEANLRLRGTVASPALQGRIDISQGEVIFFGNKYTISQGTISFFNLSKIEPILKVDLQTKARGVDVTLTVTGPPGNFSMTHRSDPPLELSDILALLATGRVPDNPSLAARGNAPTQSFEQLGASAVIGQTLANPIAGRLQRFFGVSRLKIDPQLTGVTGSPGARLTLEQQVTPDILFTYITDVSNTSQQLIQVEWSFNRNWSAILVREENGYVGLDFAYKKRFK